MSYDKNHLVPQRKKITTTTNKPRHKHPLLNCNAHPPLSTHPKNSSALPTPRITVQAPYLFLQPMPRTPAKKLSSLLYPSITPRSPNKPPSPSKDFIPTQPTTSTIAAKTSWTTFPTDWTNAKTKTQRSLHFNQQLKPKRKDAGSSSPLPHNAKSRANDSTKHYKTCTTK